MYACLVKFIIFVYDPEKLRFANNVDDDWTLKIRQLEIPSQRGRKVKNYFLRLWNFLKLLFLNRVFCVEKYSFTYWLNNLYFKFP